MRVAVLAGVLLGPWAGAACTGSEGGAAGERTASAEAEAKASARDGDATKSKDAKSGEGHGLVDRVRAIAESSGPRDPVLPAGEGIAMPAEIPPGDIIIEHRCSHSMEPFGTG